MQLPPQKFVATIELPLPSDDGLRALMVGQAAEAWSRLVTTIERIGRGANGAKAVAAAPEAPAVRRKHRKRRR